MTRLLRRRDGSPTVLAWLWGMFDSFIAKDGNDWQTKAFDCQLDEWQIGDKAPEPGDYQVEVIGYLGDEFCEVRGGIVRKVPDERDESLPRMYRFGGWLS